MVRLKIIEDILDSDLKEIKSIINQMKNIEKKSGNFSESYGIVVNLDSGALYGCEYFNQEEVDKLNLIIKKYE